MNFKHTPWNQRHTIWIKFEVYLSILSHPMSTAAADCQLPFHKMSQMSNSGGFLTSGITIKKELVYGHKASPLLYYAVL